MTFHILAFITAAMFVCMFGFGVRAWRRHALGIDMLKGTKEDGALILRTTKTYKPAAVLAFFGSLLYLGYYIQTQIFELGGNGECLYPYRHETSCTEEDMQLLLQHEDNAALNPCSKTYSDCIEGLLDK